jgi:hypothetical protein
MDKQVIADQELVEAYLQKLSPEVFDTVEYLRQQILSVDDKIAARIKWNSPSFYYTGEMEPFAPKEYKRDLIVFNIRKGRVLLVFPTGASIVDPTGVLEGNYTDGRRIVTINGIEEAKLKSNHLKTVISLWLAQI